MVLWQEYPGADISMGRNRDTAYFTIFAFYDTYAICKTDLRQKAKRQPTNFISKIFDMFVFKKTVVRMIPPKTAFISKIFDL
jgi:hypothetical protein